MGIWEVLATLWAMSGFKQTLFMSAQRMGNVIMVQSQSGGDGKHMSCSLSTSVIWIPLKPDMCNCTALRVEVSFCLLTV